MYSRSSNQNNSLFDYLNLDDHANINAFESICDQIEEFLYFEVTPTPQQVMQAVFSQEIRDKLALVSFQKRTELVIQYLENLMISGKVATSTVYQLTLALQTFVNSRNYQVAGKHTKSDMLGFSLIKSSAALQNLNDAIEKFSQKVKLSLDNKNSGWLTGANILAGLMSAVNELVQIEKNSLKIGLLILPFFNIVAQAQSPVPTEDMVLYLPFDGTAKDNTGHHDPVIFGAKLTTDINGNPNSAFEFDGSSYMLGLANKLPEADKTVSFFMEPYVVPNYGSGVDRGGFVFGFGGGYCDSLIVVLNNLCATPPNSFDLQSHCAVNRVLYVNSSMYGAPSIWMQWAMTTSSKNGTSMYINGELVAWDPTIYMNNTHVHGKDYVVGSVPDPSGKGVCTTPCKACGSGFIGKLDEFRVYSVALSAYNISLLANTTSKLFVPSTPVTPPVTKKTLSIFDKYNKATFWIAGGTVLGSSLLLLCMWRNRVVSQQELERKATEVKLAAAVARATGGGTSVVTESNPRTALLNDSVVRPASQYGSINRTRR